MEMSALKCRPFCSGLHDHINQPYNEDMTQKSDSYICTAFWRLHPMYLNYESSDCALCHWWIGDMGVSTLDVWGSTLISLVFALKDKHSITEVRGINATKFILCMSSLKKYEYGIYYNATNLHVLYHPMNCRDLITRQASRMASSNGR